MLGQFVCKATTFFSFSQGIGLFFKVGSVNSIALFFVF